MLLRSGWTVKRLAKEANVNASALSRYLGMKEHGQTITEKIIPFVYGERIPTPAASDPESPPDS